MQRPQQGGGCWHSGRACEASVCPTACEHLCSSCFQAAGMRYCARSHQQQIAAMPPFVEAHIARPGKMRHF